MVAPCTTASACIPMHTPKMGNCMLALSSSPHTPADSNDAHDRRQNAGQKRRLSKLQEHRQLPTYVLRTLWGSRPRRDDDVIILAIQKNLG